MALATQCPHCKTTFRVAQDQLKLRAGLVRCGSCKEIFNGVEHLVQDEPAAAKSPSPAPTVPTTPTEPSIPLFLEKRIDPPAPPPAPIVEPEPVASAAMAARPVQAVTPHVAPTHETLDFIYPDSDEPEAESSEFGDFVEVPQQVSDAHEPSPAGPADRHEPQEPHLEPAAESAGDESDEPVNLAALEALSAEVERKAAMAKKAAEAEPGRLERDLTDTLPADSEQADEPDFVKQARRKQGIGRALRIVLGLGSVLLLLGALAQATYAFREQIAARVPESRQYLETACSYLQCIVGLPTQIDNISIESDELVTLNPNKNTSQLTMLLRNVGPTVQAWPHIELTLNDANGGMLARRVFAPTEYLSPQDVAKGLGGNSEQPVKLYFEFSGAKPAGYHVGLFYP